MYGAIVVVLCYPHLEKNALAPLAISLNVAVGISEDIIVFTFIREQNPTTRACIDIFARMSV
jgi:hypothetical protein